ncbi:MAG TPA: bifunctional oligoribonuclease/PAP phosphatase NrnA [Clostridia bacterium]|nr:bifunctional oligoribonuclease/PAP phosphatase NrnA [Clostridia bacterium]
MTEQFKEKLKRYIQNAKSVGVFTHVRPDGDTIGSGLAIYSAVKALGKEAEIYCGDMPPKRLASLPGCNEIKTSCNIKHDLAIAVDCASIERLGPLQRDFLRCRDKVLIDQHKTQSGFGDLYIVEEAGAVGELVYEFLDYAGWLTLDAAACLYAAIVTDTGCFSFSSTTGQTMKIAAELMTTGIDAFGITYQTYRAKSIEVFNLANRALVSCRFFDGNTIAVLTFTREMFKETGASILDTEGIITGIVNIDTVEFAAALTEVNQYEYRVSVRTKYKIDAAELAASFGGGGHTRASGFKLSGFYEDVVDKIIKSARDRM